MIRMVKMENNNDYSKILSGNGQLSKYPMEKLKQVDKPTTIITDNIQRFDERKMGFARAFRGELGPLGDMMPSHSGSAAAITMSLMAAVNSIEGPGKFSFPPFGGHQSPMPPEEGMQNMKEMMKNISRSPMIANEDTGMTGMQARMRQMMAVMSGEPAPEKTILPDDPHILSRHIKSVSYFLGADVVSICKLPRWAVYSHDMQGNPVECDHKYAICIVTDQGYNAMEASSGHDWMGSPGVRAYAICGFIGHILSNYIRMLGYPARLNYMRDYQILVTPLLLLSGVGELSRAGIVLNPFLGLRFKASVVTTDLPLEPDKPVDFGLQDFCEKCKKCAVECPSQSISTGDKVIKNGYENWELNSDTCTKYRLGNPHGISCGRCIRVCPWNKPEGRTHDLVRWMVRHAPFMNSFFIKMDDIWGYGKPDINKQWWFNPPR